VTPGLPTTSDLSFYILKAPLAGFVRISGTFFEGVALSACSSISQRPDRPTQSGLLPRAEGSVASRALFWPRRLDIFPNRRLAT